MNGVPTCSRVVCFPATPLNSVEYGEHAVLLIRQLDSIQVLLFPFVLLGKNPFQPVRLPLGDRFVCEGGVMKHGELLAATFTAKGAHFLESRGPLSGLTVLDRHCLHRLRFYPAAHPFLIG
jgi:hypothetical protein